MKDLDLSLALKDTQTLCRQTGRERKSSPRSSDSSSGRDYCGLLGTMKRSVTGTEELFCMLLMKALARTLSLRVTTLFFHSSSLLLMQKSEGHLLKKNVVVHTVEERAKQLNLWKDRNWRISGDLSKSYFAFKLYFIICCLVFSPV